MAKYSDRAAIIVAVITAASGIIIAIISTARSDKQSGVGPTTATINQQPINREAMPTQGTGSPNTATYGDNSPVDNHVDNSSHTTYETNNGVRTGNNSTVTFNDYSKHTTNYNVFTTLSSAEKNKIAAEDPGLESAVQGATASRVLIVPKLSEGENIFSPVKDPVTRIGLSKVAASFMDNGYSVVKVPDLKLVDRLKLPGRSAYDKAQAIYLSGAGIFIEVDIIKNSADDESSVTVILSAYDRSNGNLLAEETFQGNEFRTADYGLLLEAAIPAATTNLINKLKHKV